MTRLLLCLSLCLPFYLDCGPKRADTPEQVITYGRLAVVQFNQRNERVQRLILKYNKTIRQLHQLEMTLDIHRDTSEAQRELLKDALDTIGEIRQLYDDSTGDLKRIEETLRAML